MDKTGPRIYYRRSGIRITSDFLFVSERRFALGSLTDLRTIQSSIFTRGLSGGFLVGILIATVAGWPFLRWATIALNVAVAAVFVLVVLRRRFARRYELWADYRGQETRLLVMHDLARYGQVCRALLRAQEAHRST